MSQSQSFSGKICVSCSKSSFALQDTRTTYSSSGTSIQHDTYVCRNCDFMIEFRSVKHISNIPKPKAITLTGSPLTNLSLQGSSSPLKFPYYHWSTDLLHGSDMRVSFDCVKIEIATFTDIVQIVKIWTEWHHIIASWTLNLILYYFSGWIPPDNPISWRIWL
jgi:hypothetical protein